MMRNRRSARTSATPRNRSGEGLRSARGLVAAAILVVAALALAWMCIVTTMVQVLPPAASPPAGVAGDDPDIVLSHAATALVKQRGRLDAPTLAAVRRAAAAAPLDARAYLILGHQQLLDGEPRRALATLEAGQRLDPRQRLIHLLLLDRYLRTARYADAATQLSLLSRLLGGAQGAIATAMAEMSLAPETRDAVRRTLATDPRLERLVLTALARSNTPPGGIFGLASRDARADAGNKDSWGPVLVARLVEQGAFAAARTVWATIYRLPATAVAAPIFDAAFAKSPASAPFNWTLVAGSIGAADIRNGSLAIDYYGRDNGALASQLLVLAPGRYRFAFTVDPGKTDTASRLLWTIACTTGAKATLATVPVVAGAARRRIAAELAVPAGCPAQLLQLSGEAGDFPAPINVALRSLEIRATGARP
jgi:hypothetical protein